MNMKVKIKRNPDSVPDSLTRSALEFACDYLDLTRTKYHLNVTFEDTSLGPRGEGEETFGLFEVNAGVENAGCVYVARHFPRWFAFWTFFHEMVHVKQHARGEIYWYFEGTVNWKGKRYVKPTTFFGYYILPWEIEARWLSHKMFFLWVWRERKALFS
jgi:hypothetical protein